MKRVITNKNNLPNAYVLAVQNDPYDPNDGGEKSDYTITGLLKPARAARIEATETIEVDASDMLAIVEGQLIHALLERAKPELEAQGYVVERRFYKDYTIEIDGAIKTFKVSAKIDVFDPVEGRLSDYKYTSVASASHGLKEAHRYQVNFQGMLVEQKGFKVDMMETVMLQKDWSPMRVFGDYPTSPTDTHPVPKMSHEEIDAFIIERIKAHEAAKVELPECTPEERFSRPTFAVVSSLSDKRAKRVFNTKEEAVTFAGTATPALMVVERPGISLACLYYCPARQVCAQAKQYQPKIEVDSEGFTKV